MTTNVLTEIEQETFRKLLAFLKGQIVGYAVCEGMNHSSLMKPSDEFIAGYAVAESDSYWSDGDWVTVRHILHNRLRHDRPHTGSVASDNEILKRAGYQLGELLGSIESNLGSESRAMLEGLK